LRESELYIETGARCQQDAGAKAEVENLNCREQAWVLKKSLNGTLFICEHAVAEFFVSVRLSKSAQTKMVNSAQ
jgi:hypothetical protein